MKRKVTNSIYAPLRWLSLVVVMLVGFLSEVQASDDYYFKATLQPYPAGAGKVYINNTTTNNPPVEVTGSQHTIGWGQGTLHLKAEANNHYLFSHWTTENPAVNPNAAHVGTDGDTSYNPTITYNSKSKSNPTTFEYYAVFLLQDGLIQVRSADPSKGSVTNSNPRNGIGDEVTLIANPDVSNGVMFLGWTKGENTQNSTNYIYTENPLTLTANSETEGVYYAHFSEAADKVFVRMQNKKTGRFISFWGDNPDGNPKGAANHTRTMSGSTRNDGFKFDKCWELISEEKAQGNPETVFLRAGHSAGTGVTSNSNLTAHDKAYTTLIRETSANTQKHLLTFEKSGDVYYIYTTFEANGGSMRSYFCDEGTQWLVMKSVQGLEDIDPESYQWYVYTLDENSTVGAFGANTKEKFTRDGKYYTTMFADFPYKCLPGVNAYYLDIDTEEFNHEMENHVVHFTKVPNGIVPANLPVILECDAIQNEFKVKEDKTVVLNRLVPLVDTSSNPLPKVSDFFPDNKPQFLHGYVLENNKNAVVNNSGTMYVLSNDDSSKENHLGFYHSTKSTMTPNKAYLDTRVDVSNNPVAAQMTFAFGKDNEGNTNKIILHDMMVADEDAPIYDLLGRKMTGILPKGIYIRNGKKFLVK